MPDLQKLNADKERIIYILKIKGPSFPARISKEVEIPPLFVSAILAELVSEKRLKMSGMKVGSSPLYYLPGQDHLLENFSQYLNFREREALEILKQNKLLEDEKQEPAIRVALRAIRDFAIPITVRVNNETKIVWRHFSMSNSEAMEKIPELFNPQTKQERVIENQKNSSEIKIPLEEVKAEKTELKSEKPESPNKEFPQDKIEETKKNQTQIKENNEIENIHDVPTKSKPKKIQKNYEFPEQIKDYLLGKDVELLEEISNKKKELISKVRTDTLFGKQEYYLHAKDKKKITEQDFVIAIQKAQVEKMPALFISSGDPDKNAKDYLKTWRNLIKFEKINL